MKEFIKISDVKCEIIIDLNLFSQTTIFKSVSWFIDKCNFHYENLNNNMLKITVEKKQRLSDFSVDEFHNKFNFYLNDFKTREIIHSETKNIRDILMIKAFSNIPDFNEDMLEHYQKKAFNE